MRRVTPGALRYAPQRIAEKLGETIETVYGEREGGFLRALLLGRQALS